jgi:L-gulonolactone oxidase
MSPLSTIPLHSLYAQVNTFTVHQARFINWGRTFACTPLAVFEPESEYHCELVLELARREGKTVRAVGRGHSPSDLACTTDYMLRIHKLDSVLKVNKGYFRFTDESIL